MHLVSILKRAVECTMHLNYSFWHRFRKNLTRIVTQQVTPKLSKNNATQQTICIANLLNKTTMPTGLSSLKLINLVIFPLWNMSDPSLNIQVCFFQSPSKLRGFQFYHLLVPTLGFLLPIFFYKLRDFSSNLCLSSFFPPFFTRLEGFLSQYQAFKRITFS